MIALKKIGGLTFMFLKVVKKAMFLREKSYQELYVSSLKNFQR